MESNVATDRQNINVVNVRERLITMEADVRDVIILRD